MLNGAGKVIYTPNSAFRGIDSFTYRAHDGSDPSAPATVTVTVLPPPSVTFHQFDGPDTSRSGYRHVADHGEPDVHDL